MVEGLTYIDFQARLITYQRRRFPYSDSVRTRRGVEQWQLVGLITRRSEVRILPPLPTAERRRERAAMSSRAGSNNRRFSGGQSEAEPPVPIPNTEVKRLSADDTGGAIL